MEKRTTKFQKCPKCGWIEKNCIALFMCPKCGWKKYGCKNGKR